jgi:5-methylcytosine-specific restriction endonuclease McrA
MDAALRRLVRERAGDRCEYCRIHQDQDAFFTFPIDHVIAQQHGGKTEVGNLCLSCYRCNSHKGPNIASIDPDTGEMVRLFHPREDDWREHFEWQNALLTGRTPIGRATVNLLAVNHPDYVLLREALRDEGTFPPA